MRPIARLMLLAAVVGCGSEDGRPAEWEYISPVIFQPNCATTSCHSPANAAAGLDFSNPGRGYESLFRLEVWIVDKTATPGQGGCMRASGTVVCPRPVRSLVVPFDPAQSRLVNMLRARGAARMPPDRPLSEADIQLVERWILNGAPWKARNASDGGQARAADAATPMLDARGD